MGEIKKKDIVNKACEEIGTEVIAYVPRSGDIQIAENLGGTVFEFVPESPMHEVYLQLADKVLA